MYVRDEVSTARGRRGRKALRLSACLSFIFFWHAEVNARPPVFRFQETTRAAAEKLYREGEELRARNTKEMRARALEKFQAALALWQTAADRRGEALTLQSIAAVYNESGDAKQALETSARALPLFQALKDSLGEAETHSNIASYYVYLSEPRQALVAAGRALEILRQTPDPAREGTALNILAMAHDDLGEPRQAMEFLQRALVLRRAAGDRVGMANTLSNIGSIHDTLGELQTALDYYMQVLPLYQEAQDRRKEAIALNNLGYAWARFGDLSRALDYYGRALKVREEVGDRRGEAVTLSNIGSIYYRLGENERALAEYNKSLALFQTLGDRSGEARTLRNLGSLYTAIGEGQKALDIYTRTLQLDRDKKDRQAEGSTLGNIGFTHFSMKNYGPALDYLNQSLAAARATENRTGEGEALRNLGRVYAATGESARAAAAFDQALAIYRQAGSRESEAVTLHESARTEMARGNLPLARQRIEAAIETVESLRGKFASQALRVALLADRQNYYRTYLDVLVRLHEREPAAGHEARALQVYELARARGLLDMLSEARADIRRGVEPALLERERTLQRRLNEKELYRMSLLREKGREKQLAEVEAELNTLLAEHLEAQAEIRARSPQYAALTLPRPLTLPEIQTRVLDAETVLLEYALGEERSYLWFVTPNDRAVYALPPREEIERHARRVYQYLSARPDSAPRETTRQNAAQPPPSRAAYDESLMALSRLLLGPVAGKLAGKRLLIVSEGTLQYIPFGALPQPSPGSNGPARPLTLDHEVLSAPSASVVALLRNEYAGRQPAPKTIAVLADPVFRPDDPRLAQSSRNGVRPAPAPAAGESASLERSAREAGAGDFTRLRFSRQEAESIAALVPRRELWQALDFDANRRAALDPALGEYRILHLATHGFLNSRHPELSGLVLSLVDEKGAPQDGFLRFHELYNLKLNADLVVLSACQTALGKEVRGEGLIGLTRGFMYAGAPRVLASLWRVDDRATAELMKRFYRALLHDGLKPAAALRAAQAAMLRERRWREPHYWAGFTLQGDWK